MSTVLLLDVVADVSAAAFVKLSETNTVNIQTMKKINDSFFLFIFMSPLNY